MTESLSQTIHNSDIREKFSDDLDRYIQNAAKEIFSHCSSSLDNINLQLFRDIKEILMENIYIPVVMGEDEYKGK